MGKYSDTKGTLEFSGGMHGYRSGPLPLFSPPLKTKGKQDRGRMAERSSKKRRRYEHNHARGVLHGSLLKASKRGSVFPVWNLLQQGALPNQMDANGDTPLIHASSSGFLGVVRELLRGRADPNQSGSDGRTPLVAAIVHGHTGVVRELLEYDADPNHADLLGETPLLTAIFHRQAGAVEVLLESGADPNHVDGLGGTPLIMAITHGLPEVGELLLQNGADPDPDPDPDATSVPSPLSLLQGAPRLFRPHVCVLYHSLLNASLVKASSRGETDKARRLLQLGADPDCDGTGCTALVTAIYHRRLHTVRELLRAGADPDKAGRGTESALSPLYVAYCQKYTEMVRVLLQWGADPGRVPWERDEEGGMGDGDGEISAMLRSAREPWTVESHHLFPAPFRSAVHTLLCVHSRRPGLVGDVEVWLHVLSFVGRDWFSGKRKERVYPMGGGEAWA